MTKKKLALMGAAIPVAVTLLVATGYFAYVKFVLPAISYYHPTVDRSGDACDHPYYPLVSGYEIDYRISGGGGKFINQTIGVTRAEKGEVVLSYRSDIQEDPVSQTVYCEDGSVFMREDAGGGPISGALDIEGPYIPGDFRVGTSWSTSFVVPGQQADPESGDAEVPVDIAVSISSEVVAEEDVTVPAGTFRALKVRSTKHAELAEGGESFGLFMVDVETDEWWVRDVGLVKTETRGAPGGDLITEATVIRSE